MRRFAAVLSLSLFVVGCVPSSSLVGGPFYSAPNVLEEPTAFLTGSAMPGTVFVRIPVFPFAVDGVRVQNGVNYDSVPLTIRPGSRTITAELNHHPYYARADLTFTAKDGEDYIIQFTTDVGPSGGNSFCEFWISDAKTGSKVTAVTRVNVFKK